MVGRWKKSLKVFPNPLDFKLFEVVKWVIPYVLKKLVKGNNQLL